MRTRTESQYEMTTIKVEVHLAAENITEMRNETGTPADGEEQTEPHGVGHHLMTTHAKHLETDTQLCIISPLTLFEFSNSTFLKYQVQ